MATVDLQLHMHPQGFWVYRPVKSAILKNKTHACAVCFCLGFPRSFASDTSPNRIDREPGGRKGRFDCIYIYFYSFI